MIRPMSLPSNFDPGAALPAKTTEYGAFHEVRAGASLAAQLIANGAAEDIELAHIVLEAVLRCQERDPRDPHLGAFRWMAEDTWIEDLNAVTFVLRALIPMMIRHGDRLRPPLHGRVLDAIRLGLGEIARLDVLPAYTNITALDIANTCLGGELLHDPALLARGRAKLATWIEFTNRSGHPHEFNSPTYLPVSLRALGGLVELSQDAATRSRARALLARLGLSAVLHLHHASGRWAGPYGRAYQPTIMTDTPPERMLLDEWIAGGILPGWLATLWAALPADYTVTETASRQLEMALTTTLTPAYALGVAGKGLSPQSNVVMAHMARPGQEHPGVFYTRCIVDDKWLGDSYHRTDRTRTRNLLDEGEFWGVQAGSRALGVYTPARLGETQSVKVAWIWVRRATVDALWVDSTRVEALPYDVPPGATVVAAVGDAYVAVHPLAFTRLGSQTPLRLVERQGDLVLERYSYQGSAKTFWELNWPGAFFQGRPFSAFYVELAARGAYPDGAAFAQSLAQGQWDEHLDPGYTYAGQGERRYRVSYGRGEDELGIEIDLMQWRLLRRWSEAGELGWPALAAPFARQRTRGPIRLDGATVESDHGPIWLAALPHVDLYVAGYLGLEPADVTLTTPHGISHITGMEAGVIAVQNGITAVEAPYAGEE